MVFNNSIPSFVSFRTAFITPVQMIDGKKTAGVQAWTVIHPTEIIKHIPFKALYSFFMNFICRICHALYNPLI